MNKKNLVRRIGGFFLAVFLLSGIPTMSISTVQAQGRVPRRVIIVRPYRFHRPFYPYRSWYSYP
jgi:hypothetical protein